MCACVCLLFKDVALGFLEILVCLTILFHVVFL